MKKNSLCKMVAISAAPGSGLQDAIFKAVNLGICTVYQGVINWQDEYKVGESTDKYIKAGKVEGNMKAIPTTLKTLQSSAAEFVEQYKGTVALDRPVTIKSPLLDLTEPLLEGHEESGGCFYEELLSKTPYELFYILQEAKKERVSFLIKPTIELLNAYGFKEKSMSLFGFGETDRFVCEIKQAGKEGMKITLEKNKVSFNMGEKDSYSIRVCAWPSGAKYDGQWKGGKEHGSGVCTWADGREYNGEWKDGKPHGPGVYTWADGGKYVGDFKDSKRDGCGVYTWADGREYDGQWRDGNYHGRGVMTSPDGDKYIGDFKYGAYHGRGFKTYLNGSTYKGQWKGGKPHGRGVRTHPNGYIYEGNFKDGRPDGRGVLEFVQKRI